MDLLEYLYALEPRSALAAAISLSILLFTLGANLSWASVGSRSERFSRIAAWWRRLRIRGALVELTRWAFYLGLPWSTLVLGYSSPRALGVWNLDWTMNLGIAALIAVGSIIVFEWVWQSYTRSEHSDSVDLVGWNSARHILEAIYREAHWAFYRSGPILWLGDFYWGSFIGLGLVLIEGWSNPAVRANIRDITRADAPLWAGSLAIVSVLIFNYTQNTWYCLGVHICLNFLMRRQLGFSRRRRFPRPTQATGNRMLDE